VRSLPSGALGHLNIIDLLLAQVAASAAVEQISRKMVPLRDRMDRVRPPTDAELGFIADPGRELHCPTRTITLNLERYCAWRDAMDHHGQLEYGTARGNDYPSHEQTYRSFLTVTKIAAGVIAVIVILMAIFLT